MTALTSVRVYAVVIAILCESIRATSIWPSPVTPLLWILDVHWAITTPLLFATLVPTISIAAIFSIITGVTTLIFGILTLLATVVTLRCNVACISTAVPDSIRVVALGFLTLFSLFISVEWWNVETQRNDSLRGSLALLTLLGVVPSAVLSFSTWGILALPAFAIDPAIFWATLLNRRHTYPLAFAATCLLLVFDILHGVLFNDTKYFFNILVLRTIIDAGRLYIRLKTI